MNWGQIETKWADMARRIQVEWPFRPIFAQDNSVSDKRSKVLDAVEATKAVAIENPKAKDARLPVQISVGERPARDDQPAADYDTSRSQA